MQLASITFDGEKKNSKNYIIPASYFKAKGIKPIPVKLPKETAPEKEIAQVQQVSEEKIGSQKQGQPSTQNPSHQVQEPRAIVGLKTDRRTSGLSLKSIREKKEHLIKQMDVVVAEDDLPTEAFTQEQFNTAWKEYISQLDKKGEKIMVSILEMDTPKLNGTDIKLAFPNETLRVELERAQFPLMEFLRKKLRNFSLKLDITVNEDVAKKYVFTAEDKYEKLKEKNPNIELLRLTFGLDL
jgi:DNA polymerase-3 subunit gamma/tau